LVRIGQKKEIKEIEVIGQGNDLQIVSRHSFGISIISLQTEDALRLNGEINEWLEEKKAKVNKLTV
jgi:hypothetical protein